MKVYTRRDGSTYTIFRNDNPVGRFVDRKGVRYNLVTRNLTAPRGAEEDTYDWRADV